MSSLIDDTFINFANGTPISLLASYNMLEIELGLFLPLVHSPDPGHHIGHTYSRQARELADNGHI